ncbi:hypothetical protein F6B43_12650 [Microbacterium rhizomatis]|uniref:BMP family ABC transporter substrate-binding protein n=1 Tax=Microbacterium rhizomatis TaxID=1631477 RepID=A0A5J5J1Y6_9MICO|nr:hypothetical protein F6B43_12650 [Microbacterium rhizomatis]
MAASCLATGLLCALLLSGCASDWSQPHEAPTPVGTLGAGFVPTATPSPEATILPASGSWDDVRASPGMRVVLLTADADAPTATISEAVRTWARENGADLREVSAADDHIDGIVAAMDENPDLIVTGGNSLIDALAAVTPNHLDRQFLVLGAELAEPTHNVTAVDWTGASFRGEGLGAASAYDEATFTPERSAAAVRAGVAAVLHGMTGIVLWID